MHPPIESNTVGIMLRDRSGKNGRMIREQMKLGPVFVRGISIDSHQGLLLSSNQVRLEPNEKHQNNLRPSSSGDASE